ncbi:bifunctional metallophosphatase/5'-nucleotidase [Brevibacillus fulvus]|uniref:2',3'-cyclic-nucleotide 2'-phosphodiesterase (5'-nucleotidase family) n=1 Tax=Brevibacillus fulvus TaxID=1125967 RepID=A0A939BV20_9BACL|nr:bifunctional UDP-sugar hydrolase/5'-nucleotidase [Brevibacillus fulvus]MBM7591019.1 2',3'-cyclic-nucleotide 2'-phosphodiesterase (5'-nucleotidase family) [Brevibacillus fulvus]
MASTCTLHILHTNDLHSQFSNMPRIASCLKQQRAAWEERGDYVLTVDIGDHLDRYNIKTEASWGHANVQVLNESGYQYVTIGNNEGVTLPKDKLDALYQHAAFTVIVSNLLELDGTLPRWAVPFAIHRWNQLQVAILGVTVSYASVYETIGWNSQEPHELLRQQIDSLREQVDAIILLSHLGYNQDVELAKQFPQIDVILGAHSHHLLKQGERIGHTLITQAGKYGDYIGHVELTIDLSGKSVTAAQSELLAAADYPADQALLSFLEQEEQKSRQVLCQEAAILRRDLPVAWDRESPLATFLAASLRQWTGAEIGLANSGLLLKSLPAGSVTKLDLLQSLPHPINPCTLLLTGEELWQLLQACLQPRLIERQLHGFGFRGKVMGWMAVDGLEIDYRDDEHPVITQIRLAGNPIERNQLYRVATVDMFIFNRLFPQLQEGRDLTFFLPEMLREIILETVSDEHLLESCFATRWHKLA